MSDELSFIDSDMPAEDYHEHPALGKTGLVKVLRSVSHYNHSQLNPTRSTAFTIGSAVHELLLMGRDNYEPAFVVRPQGDEGNFRKTVGKEWRDAQHEAGLEIVTAEQSRNIERACNAAWDHPKAGLFFEESFIERSHFWQDSDTGLQCKSRPDMLTKDGVVMIDLKTAEDASHVAIQRAIARYRYDMQWAHYGAGVEDTTGVFPQKFLILAVEPKPPFGVAIYDLHHDWKYSGELYVRRALEKYAAVLDDLDNAGDGWAGYPREIQAMEMPRWAS